MCQFLSVLCVSLCLFVCLSVCRSLCQSVTLMEVFCALFTENRMPHLRYYLFSLFYSCLRLLCVQATSNCYTNFANLNSHRFQSTLERFWTLVCELFTEAQGCRFQLKFFRCPLRVWGGYRLYLAISYRFRKIINQLLSFLQIGFECDSIGVPPENYAHLIRF